MNSVSGAALGNYKSALQEHLQAAHAGTPVYRVKSESGPDHRKRFLVEVRLKAGRAASRASRWREASDSTKKDAEQDAARRALARLNAPGRTNFESGDTIKDLDPTDEDLSTGLLLEQEEQAAQ